jgi:hypothetical protein
MVIGLVTLFVRWPTFGNPMLEFDEQLYLLMGDRLWHGQLPYLDLWDRKPVGLFLFYALIRLLGGLGVVQYQAVATLCAAATAMILYRLARRKAAVWPALLSALAYVFTLNLLHGTGGQTSVFYNLLTAGCFWAAFAANDANRPWRIIAFALPAMLVMGLALQIKYTVVFEGISLGCWFLWRLHRVGLSVPRLSATALAMMVLALLPTLAALGWYAGMGHADAFVQANFVSVFHRAPFDPVTRREQASYIAVRTLGLIAALPVALVVGWRQRQRGNPHDFALLCVWTAGALIGFAMLGDVFDHYFIPVTMPLCVALAPLLRRGRGGFILGCMVTVWPLAQTPPYYFGTAYYQREVSHLAAATRPYLRGHCLYVFDGPTILYHVTGACAPTRYIYPDHLNNPIEAPALGVDSVQEEQRLLARRPGAIVTASVSVNPHVNVGTQRVLRAALARDYVLVDKVRDPERMLFVWARRDLHPGPAPITDHRAANPQ